MEAVRKVASFDSGEMSEGTNLFDNVRAKIVAGTKFTKEPPDNYQAEGNPIFAHVEFLIDGEGPEEERRVSQSFSLGAKAGENFEISGDGQSLVPLETNVDSDGNIISQLRKDSKFGTLMSSLKAEGVPATVLQSGSLKSLVNLDGQWKRVADKARTFATDRPNRKASKFPPSTLVLVKLYALPGQATATTGKTSTTTAAAPVADGLSLDDATEIYLLDVVSAAKDKKIQRANLLMAVSKAALAKGDSRRTEIAKRSMEEDFLVKVAGGGLITYDPAAKPQVVAIAA